MATIIVGAYGNRYPCTPGYRCIGVHDETVINAAITAAGSGGLVKLTSGNFNIADDILLTENVSLRGSVHTVLKFTSPTVYALRLFCYGSTDPDAPQRIMRLRIVGEGTMEITGSNVRVSHCWSEQYGKGEEAFNIASGNGTTQSNIRFDYCVANRTSGSGFVVNFEAVVDTETTIEDVSFVNCRAIGCGADWTMVTRSGDWESAHWVAGFLLGEASQGALSVTNNILAIDCVAEGCLESGFYVEPGQAATNCRLDRCISRNNAQKSNYLKLNFDTGSVAPVHGEIVTGATSGATGRLVWWQMHPGGEIQPYFSGTWAGGDAAGASVIGEVRGTFVAGETINGSNGCVFKVATDGLSQMVPWFGAGYLLTTGYSVTDCLSDGNARGFHFGISSNNPRPSYPIRVSRCIARNPSGLGVDANNGLGFNFSGGPDEYQLADVIADNITIENCGTWRCLLFDYCVSPIATGIQVIEPCGDYVASACTGTPVLTEENELNYLDSLPSGAVALYLPTEEGRNLMPYSQQFDKWSKIQATVNGNVAIAPDGTMTADGLTETTVSGGHYCYRYLDVPTASVAFSVYVKAGSRSWTCLRHAGGGMAHFDLVNGAAGYVNPGYTSSIVSVGEGWYRCSIAGTGKTGSYFAIYSAIGDQANSYDGDAAQYPNGTYLWGAQVEVGPYATTYYPTTDKQILKDYANRSRNLLLPTIANGTSDGTTSAFATWGTGVTLSSSTEQFWQGSRSLKVVCDGTVAGQGQYYQWFTYGLSPGKTYTGSVYVKGTAGATLTLHLAERTDAGTATGGGANVNFTATGGWDRVVATFTAGATGRCANMRVVVNGTLATTFYCDGLQLEEGSVATPWQAPPNHGILGSALGSDTNDPTWTGRGLAFATDDYATISELLAGATEATVIMAMNVTADVAAAGYLSISGSDENPSLFTLSLRRGAAPGPSGDFLNLSVSDGTAITGLDTSLVGIDGGTSQYRAVTARYVGGTKMDLGFAPGPYALQTTAVPATLNAAPNGMMTIGRSNTNYLTGGMTALGVWRRHLSDAEVAQAYVSLRGYLAKFGVMLQ